MLLLVPNHPVLISVFCVIQDIACVQPLPPSPPSEKTETFGDFFLRGGGGGLLYTRYPRSSWIVDSSYCIPDSLSVELGLRFPIVSGILDSLNWTPRIPNSTSKNLPNSGIRISAIKCCLIPLQGRSKRRRKSQQSQEWWCIRGFSPCSNRQRWLYSKIIQSAG